MICNNSMIWGNDQTCMYTFHEKNLSGKFGKLWMKQI